jgi:hypothetical protein
MNFKMKKLLSVGIIYAPSLSAICMTSYICCRRNWNSGKFCNTHIDSFFVLVMTSCISIPSISSCILWVHICHLLYVYVQVYSFSFSCVLSVLVMYFLVRSFSLTVHIYIYIPVSWNNKYIKWSRKLLLLTNYWQVVRLPFTQSYVHMIVFHMNLTLKIISILLYSHSSDNS